MWYADEGENLIEVYARTLAIVDKDKIAKLVESTRQAEAAYTLAKNTHGAALIGANLDPPGWDATSTSSGQALARARVTRYENLLCQTLSRQDGPNKNGDVSLTLPSLAMRPVVLGPSFCRSLW